MTYCLDTHNSTHNRRAPAPPKYVYTMQTTGWNQIIKETNTALLCVWDTSLLEGAQPLLLLLLSVCRLCLRLACREHNKAELSLLGESLQAHAAAEVTELSLLPPTVALGSHLRAIGRGWCRNCLAGLFWGVFFDVFGVFRPLSG